MAVETDKVEPADSEQDEEEDVYEVERIIDMRVEEGEVLYRVRWKNYCSDDDTWEPEAHLEDCREVLLAFKKSLADAKAKKEAEAKKCVKLLPTKSDVFDADSESDSDKDRPAEAPVKKKKKKKIRGEEEEAPSKDKKKKKKKEKRKDEVRPLPAPETDEEEERIPTPPSSPKEKKNEPKKRVVDSDEDDDEPVPTKKHKRERGKEAAKQRKEKADEGKKKRGKKERKMETSEDEATAPLEDELSNSASESQLDDTSLSESVTKSADKARSDDKAKQKKGKCDVKLQGIKDLIHDKRSKKSDQKESSLLKLKSLTSKGKEEGAPHSDSSDSSTLHKKAKSKGQESTAAPPKVASSSTSSSSSSSSSVAAPGSTKAKDDEVLKEEALGQKDATGSTNLFEKFLLNCEAKDRAPRRLPLHQPPAEKSISKPTKLIGKIEKIPRTTKESPAQKAEPEKMEKTKQSDAPRPTQSHGFSLDSDEREVGETAKPRPAEDPRDRKERPDESQRPGWDRRTPTDERRKKREDSEPRLFMACDDSQETQHPPDAADKSDKGQATLSLGMDLNLDWMTLDDFQKHLTGEDEILSGPPLSPSELRDAVKSGDYMAVKLALNSKEDYNLDQEARSVGEKRSFEGETSLTEERRSSDALRLTPSLNDARNEEGSPRIKGRNPQDLDAPKCGGIIIYCPASTNSEQVTGRETRGKDLPELKNSPAQQESQGKEGQRQTEQENMSDDTKDGLSNATGLNFDHSNPPTKAEEMPTGDSEDAEQKGGADQQASPKDANDSGAESKSVLAGQSEIVESLPQHSGETVEKKQPTRSSLRACKKVLEAEPSVVDDDEQREACKKHFCLYCKMAFSQLAKHLEKKHGEETDVAHAIHFPKGSKIRQTLLDQIRNKGDYEHNCQVLRSGTGEIISKKMVKNSVSIRDFLPCQFCFTFYRKADLWRHERSCKAQKGDQKPPEKTDQNRVHSAAPGLMPMSEFVSGGCEEIIHIMHQDEISKHVRNDPLICKYGNALAAKYYHDKSQFAYIAQKMRELGRFVLAVHELDKSVKYLHEICLPSKFELAVEGVKRLSGFDPVSSKFKTISLISKIGYSLKRAAEIAFGESRMTEDGETESEVKKFIHLLDTKWNQCFSRKTLAFSLKQEDKRADIDESTVTEDLMKLHRFIIREEDEARKELKDNPTLSTWKKLSEATLADVCLFNRGRVGNIGRMLLKTYTYKKTKGTFVLSADQIKRSTKLELDLGASFTRLELEGQYGRNMLVLLTERMVLSVDLLIENREQAGVSNTNPYLFARTEGPSFIRGLDCFRRAAMECGVKNPEALLSSSLREQIAICWQLMSLSEGELDQVAKLVEKSSQECSRLSQNPSQLEEMSKLLLKMDRTLPACPAFTPRNGAVQKPALKRRPWSEKEQAAVRHYLSEFITGMKVPGKKECNACIAAEPDLVGRSWTDVKNYVHNTLQTIRRRNNQQRPEGSESLYGGKTSKATSLTAKKELDDTNTICGLTTVCPEHLREGSNCCMTVASPAALRDSFPQDVTAAYAALCSTSSNMVRASQPLLSSFTPLNATDTQVVPTFTPHNTTSALIPPAYTSESNHNLAMCPLYTQNAAGLPPPSVYAPQDAASAMIPTYSHLSAPSTSMVPTYTSLNSPVVPTFSPLNDRTMPIVSSFTPLNHSSAPAYLTDPPRPRTSAQVVPSIHGHGVPDRALVAQGNAPTSTAERKATLAVKPQKRNKRLWSEVEQAAVRRQFGDFCKLVKVPGKKDCDACLAAEPDLDSRTWREVKYFVHNSIQSLRRKGQAVASKQSRGQEPETQTSNPEWDAPVYLSL